MDVNIISEIKDGDTTRPIAAEAPSTLDVPNQNLEGVKKKRRRGKSKRKIMKPFLKMPWQQRKYDSCKRNYRFRKMVLAKTHAPFNNNQFLMEIHKPEPENNFQNLQTPSARTRDSSFSVDSEDNYFFSLPEDEEEYLTKEFSSVYEDAQSERLSNMSKSELIEEYLLLEAKYDNLIKRNDRSKPKCMEEDKDFVTADQDTSVTDKDSMITEKDTSGTTIESNVTDESSIDVLQRLREQEEQIQELQAANEKLRLDNEHLRQRGQSSSSADSESDSSTSASDSSSSRSASPVDEPTAVEVNGYGTLENHVIANGVNGIVDPPQPQPLVNGFHNPHAHDSEIDEDP